MRGLRGGLRAWLRVPAEPEPVEHESRVPVQVPDRRRDRPAAPEDEADRQPSAAAEHPRLESSPDSDSSAVFGESDPGSPHFRPQAGAPAGWPGTGPTCGRRRS